MKLTKRFSLILIAILLSVLLVACGGTGEGESTAPETDAPTTASPETSGTEPEESTAPEESLEPEEESSSEPTEESSEPEEESSSDPIEESSEPEEESGSEPTEESSDPEEESSSEPTEESSEPEEESSSDPEESTDGQNPPEVHVHSAIFTQAKAPTCEADGNVAYYSCADCGGYFSDADCKNALATVVIPSSGHAWDAGSTVQEVSCTEDGETVFACAACGASRTETVTAPGHDWDGDRTCDAGHACLTCGETEPSLGHAHVLSEEFAGNCTVAPYKTYECTREGCEDGYTDVLGTAPGHVSSKSLPTERHIEGCKYVLVYQCAACGESYDGDTVLHHEHKASITKPATCKEDGVKTLTCACGDSYTETIGKNATGHAWKTGTVVDGKRTDTCEVCGETKSVTVFEGTSTGKTNASELANTEIEVNNASVTLDQGVVDALENKEVTLSVGKVEGDDRKNLGVDETLLSQVGDNPIYDFTINDGEKNVSEFGEENFVTITLPYELKVGEDVDSIAIWFINDKGELEAIDAVYNNGYVTFKTNHFSYYTVTRLTPEQRCAAWGHNWTKNTVEANCVREGYTLSVCARCHLSEKTVTEAAWGHKYAETVTPATCEKSGNVFFKCETCAHSYVNRIPATGHAWFESEREAASCEKIGYVVYACSNTDCTDTYREILPKLKHVYTDTVVPAACETLGYTEHVCATCKNSYRDTYVMPMGHDLTDTVVPPTCEKDGYTVHTCSRCDYEKTDTPVPSLGHDLKETVVPPSCEGEGSRTESCSRCDYSVTAPIEALGHKYASTEKAPTCTDAGSITYVCETCGDTYTETGKPALEHNYVAHPSGATCDQAGSIVYTCDRCGDSYTVDDAPALGHDYEASWAWVEDHSHATLVLTCRRDPSHKREIGATVEVVATPGDCVKDGTRLYTATAEFDGKIYKDTFTESIPTKGHDFEGGSVEHDNKTHWAVCAICGAEGEAMKHTLGEWKTVEAPTCSKNGVEKATCTEEKCGYASIERIPATGEHTYVDGVCSSCGKSDAVCDHMTLTEKVLDLGAHGFCGGMVTYESCECGETVHVNINDLAKIPCKMVTTDSNQYEDEAGNYVFYAAAYCSVCGLEATTEGMLSWKNCVQTVTYVYNIFKGDEMILANATSTEVIAGHMRVTWEAIELSELGFCGGVLELEKCADCGEIVAVASVDPKCNASVNVEEREMEDGTVHLIHTLYCPDCGLHVIDEEWRESDGSCEFTDYRNTYVYRNDELLYESESHWFASEHDDELVYEKLGETCEDGVRVNATCRVCGRTSTYTRSGHSYAWTTVDLSESGICGGVIDLYVCQICGIANSADMNLDCRFDLIALETVEIDGIEHTFDTFACKKCGLERTIDSWEERINECITILHFDNTLTLDGKELLSWNEYGEYTEHEYTYEFTMDGETCDDGYSYVAICARCGDESYGSGSGHWNRYHLVGFDELGCASSCGGDIRYGECLVCHRFSDFFVNSNCSATGELTTYTDEEGIPHSVWTYVCEKCGLVRTVDIWDVPVTPCKAEVYRNFTFVYEGKTVLEKCTRGEYSETHTYEYSFEMHGETCDDGYEMTQRCTVCGMEESWDSEGHFYDEGEKIELHDLGACHGTVYVQHCMICNNCSYFTDIYNCYGETRLDNEYVDGNGNYHRVEGFICDECGFTYTFDRCEEYVNECTTIYHDNFMIQDAQAIVVISGGDQRSETHHNYTASATMHGKHCDEGLTVTRTCSGCGKSESFDYYGCYMHTTQTELQPLGLCGGFVTESKCVACATVEYVYMEAHCKWNAVESNEEGVVVYECLNCGGRCINTVMVSDRDEQCNVVETRTTQLFANGACVLEWTENRHRTVHNFDPKYEFLDGENCENGVRVTNYCTYCGDGAEYTIYHHETISTEVYYFSDFSDCDGYLRVERCPCGRDSRVDWSLPATQYDYANYTDDDGVYHNVTYFTCCCSYECGVQIKRDAYILRENCIGTSVESYSVLLHGETVIDGIEISREEGEMHEYEYVSELLGESCEDGLYLRGTCECGATTEEYYEHHYNLPVLKVDLTQYGACTGEVYLERCPCGEYENYNYDTCAWEEISRENVKDENGVSHEITVSTCFKCSTVVTVDFFYRQEGCFERGYRKVTVVCGGETVVDGLELRWSEMENHTYAYEYVFNGESCEDGVTVYGVCECGATCEDYIDWHRETCVSHVDLQEAGACYGYVSVYRCLCGEVEYLNWESCANVWGDDQEGWYDEDKVWHSPEHTYCESCGLDVFMDNFAERDGCKSVSVTLLTITLGDRVLLNGERYITGSSFMHDYEYSFEFYGKNCYDGYTATGVCRDCGASYEEENYWHCSYPLERVDLSEYGVCDAVFERISCPCGMDESFYANFCYTTWDTEYYVDENGLQCRVEIYFCEECGLKTVREARTLKDGCKRTEVYYYSAEINGQAIFSGMEYEDSTWYDHEYVYSVELKGESCEDGYILFGICECGDIYEEESDYHNHYIHWSEFLSDYGVCQGKLRFEGCACGESGYVSLDDICPEALYDSEWHMVDDVEHYAEYYRCENCAMELIIDSWDDTVGCKIQRCFLVTLTVGGEEVFRHLNVAEKHYEHVYVATYTLEGENCEGGVSVLYTCKYCDDSYEDHVSYHATYLVEKNDLHDLTVCGGYFNFYSCACGEETYVDWSFPTTDHSITEYVDEEGRTHTVELYSCQACGLRYQTDSYSVRDGVTCTETTYYSASLSIGETAVTILTYSKTNEAHDYEQSYEMAGESCNDGVTVIRICKTCGDRTQHYTWGHETFETEVYLLSELGAACGGEFVISECLCGTYRDGAFRNLHCDFDMEWQEPWVDGVVGYNNWYIQTCAVTDPACAFSYRYGTYYLRDEGTCLAREYEVWQLGYDRQTGECLMQIVIPTGETMIAHDWSGYVEVSGNDELGAWSGYRNSCSICKSYDEEREYFDADGILIHEIQESVNKLDNGEDRRVYRRDDYAVLLEPTGSTIHELIYEYDLWVRADGTEYWEKMTRTVDYTYTAELGDWGCLTRVVSEDSNGGYRVEEEGHVYYNDIFLQTLYYVSTGSFWVRNTYTYDPNDLCHPTETHEDSYGTVDQNVIEQHVGAIETVTKREETCTQDGIFAAVCMYCSEETHEWEHSPHGHFWTFDEEKQIYFCYACGLENANGADGDVIFEDLSDSYGEGKFYVIGYHNVSQVDFTYYVTIRPISEDGTESGEEIVLDVNVAEYGETISAFTFSREEVAALASDLGYEAGSYYVAFTFVPYGADGTLDYSIVLTDESTR